MDLSESSCAANGKEKANNERARAYHARMLRLLNR